MAEDWAADVRKYAPDADDAIIAGVVRYCGIALQKVDSSRVAFSDPKELARVRQNFLKKKLALTQSDAVLDKAIAAVGERMKADRTKNRVTVYYLLAEAFGSLPLFAKASAAKKPAPAKISTTKKPAGTKASAAVGAGAAGAAALGLASLGDKAKAPVAAPAPPPAPPPPAARQAAASAAAPAAVAASPTASAAPAAVSASAPAQGVIDTGPAGSATPTPARENAGSGLGWLLWLLLALLVAFIIWWAFFRSPGSADGSAAGANQPVVAGSAEAGTTTPAVPPASAVASAPDEGSVTIPAGAGVTSETRDGKPVVKVYFDTGKTALAPAFADAAAGLKDYLSTMSGRSLAVSGYNDASGNAAANAELSKNRAQAVAAALVAAGIPRASVALVKPEQTTDASVPGDAARRVEVIVK